ncbi:Ig-like domain-containing protein [Castellaniella ginsengisoli]
MGSTGIAGMYGTLILNANGSYTYKANPNAVSADAVDHFVYTITDTCRSGSASACHARPRRPCRSQTRS